MDSLDLTRMKRKKKGTVTKILGGYGMMKKMETLGIRIGCEIEKVSSQALRGPIIVRVGNTQAAIGYGMARKIIVKIE